METTIMVCDRGTSSSTQKTQKPNCQQPISSKNTAETHSTDHNSGTIILQFIWLPTKIKLLHLQFQSEACLLFDNSYPKPIYIAGAFYLSV